MAIVSRERLADAIRDASPATFTAFVADLYAARGYDVARESEHVLTLRPSGRLVAVGHPESKGPRATVDTVVTLDASAVVDEDVRILGVEDLYEHLVYGVDSGVARDLLATHFDLESTGTDATSHSDEATDTLNSETGETAESAREREGASKTGKTESSTTLRMLVAVANDRLDRRALAVGLVALAVLVGTVGLVGAFAGAVEDSHGSEPVDRLTPVNGSALAEAHHTGGTVSTESNTPTSPVVDTDSLARHSMVAGQRASHPYPPGLNPWGVDSARRMAAAHRSELTNTSYTVRVRYQEFVDGRPTGLYTETVRVENGSRYSVSIDTVGDLRTTPRAIVGVDVFRGSDGRHFRDEPANSDIRIDVTSSRILDRVEQYLHWSLSVENSTIPAQRTASNRTVYVVTTEGDPYTGVENASGTAYVTESGLVSYGRWSYTLPRQPDVRIVFSIETTDVGSTTVVAPGWVETTAGARGSAETG